MAAAYLATHRQPCGICMHFLSCSWHPHPVSLVNEICQPPLRLAEVHMQLKSADIMFNKVRMLMRFSWLHVSFLCLAQHFL